jgi:hypothetical protein
MNNLTLRVNYTTTSADAEIDYAYVNYTFIGDPIGCFNFGDTVTAPSATVTSPVANIVLNAGTLKSVECNITITDALGQKNITGANATFFTSPSTDGSALNNLSKYLNTSCVRVASTMTTGTYSCDTRLLYYATNGTWFCNMTGITTHAIISNMTNFTVDPLYAITVNDTFLDFGLVPAGFNSGNISENISNIGNQPINISVRGYGRVPDDNNSFTCENDNITISSLHFAPNNTASYINKVPLTNLSKLLGFTVGPQIDQNLKVNTSYWELLVPSSLISVGQCNGTIVFQAELS